MRLLYVDIDTLRADHLGCAGYHRDTTPNIDQLAADGVLFENVYASDVPCLPSRTALISGMFGIRNGVVNHGGLAAKCRSPWRSERGNGRKGAVTTVFSGCSSRSALCTTPTPLCTSVGVAPGNAPQLARASWKPTPVHVFTPMLP